MKKKLPKLLMIIVLTALVIVGGSVSAFFLVNKSPKIQYFLAEAETFKQMGTIFEDRYKNELRWLEVQQEKPVETNFDLSGEWNDPSVDSDMQEVQSIVNSAKISSKQAYDPVKKELEVDLSGELGSVKMNFGSLFATTEKLVASLPFLDELVRFDDEDFGKMMREFDEGYDGNENLGLSQLFEDGFSMTEESRIYVEKEYIAYLIKEIPDKAFTSEKEELTVFDKKIKAKKVKLDLTEQQFKTLLKDLLKKAKTDKKLKTILKEQLTLTSFAGDTSDNEIATIMDGFEDGLDAAIEGVDSIKLPNGLQSTIWHHSNKIVKREFAMGVGEDKNDVDTVKISGTQLLEKTGQKWNFILGVKDSFGDENFVKVKGDLSWKDQKATDSITLTMDDMKFIYKGKEQLKDKKRTFTRSFGFTDGNMDPAVIWKGSNTHESDSMKSNHEFTFSEETMGANIFNLIIKQHGKIVKKVDMPVETEDTVNIGKMNKDEFEAFTEETMVKVQDWMFGFMEDLQGEIGEF